MVLRILNLEGHNNCMIGSKGTNIFTMFFSPWWTRFFCLFWNQSTENNGGVSRGRSVAVVVSDMWKVTCETWHVTCDIWHVTCCIIGVTIRTRRKSLCLPNAGFLKTYLQLVHDITCSRQQDKLIFVSFVT